MQYFQRDSQSTLCVAHLLHPRLATDALMAGSGSPVRCRLNTPAGAVVLLLHLLVLVRFVVCLEV